MKRKEQKQDTYLHGQSSRLLVIMIQEIGHEGGVVRQILAHSQSDGLTAEFTVALYRLHVRRTQGDEEQKEEDDNETAGRDILSAAHCYSFGKPMSGTSCADKCFLSNARHVVSVSNG